MNIVKLFNDTNKGIVLASVILILTAMIPILGVAADTVRTTDRWIS